MACFAPFYTPTISAIKGIQYELTVDIIDNYGKCKATLPTLDISGIKNPVVKIFSEPDGNLCFAMRIDDGNFTPKVRQLGSYTLSISDPDAGIEKKIEHIMAVEGHNDKHLAVSF